MNDVSVIKLYGCSNCGVSKDNRFDWCDLGCGNDFQSMMEVEYAPVMEYRKKVANQIMMTMVFPSNEMGEELSRLGIKAEGEVYEALVDHWVNLKYTLSNYIAKGDFYEV